MAEPRILRTLLLALLLGGAALAQGGWDIPHRGAIVYDRKTIEFEVSQPPSPLVGDRLITPAADGGHEWRYLEGTQAAMPPLFALPEFDDSGWELGRGEFGPDTLGSARTRSLWSSEAVCLRTHVRLAKKPKALVFDVDHDDGIRIWLNGELVLQNDGFGRGKRYVVAGSPLDHWRREDNVVAAQCTNTGGAQYLDLAMTALPSLPRELREQEALQAALDANRAATDKVRRELFGDYRPPGLLLQGDLDERGEYVRIAPADLRDVAWWVAMDLRCGLSGGSVRGDLPRLFRLGDVEIKGRADIADEAGWQTITATVKTTGEPAKRGDSPRYIERNVQRFILYGFEGELTIRRRLERQGDRLRVAEFETELHGSILRGKKWKERAANLDQRESWKFADVRYNQDAGFRALVNTAIERAVKHLRNQLKEPEKGDTQPNKPDADRSYNSGKLAIGLLALLKAGVPKDDPVVKKGFDELRKRRIIDTYSLGNALMALSALYAPRSELSDLKAGVLSQPQKRKPTPEDLALMTEWTNELLGNFDSRVDPNQLLRFHYIGAGDYDNSVNQYGLLGLYSAFLCGVEIAPQVWEAAANHLLASQSPEGAKVSLELVDYRSVAAGDESRTGAKIAARALGWNYKDPKEGGELTPTWGSMTCAGITGLAICQAALQEQSKLGRARLVSDMTRA
ncbi:MAG: hypothetical protein KDE27_10760, partial [Planctomycetes bacterium]|nr:hypothetical protein [Planctomycetota bacterium]